MNDDDAVFRALKGCTKIVRSLSQEAKVRVLNGLRASVFHGKGYGLEDPDTKQEDLAQHDRIAEATLLSGRAIR